MLKKTLLLLIIIMLHACGKDTPSAPVNIKDVDHQTIESLLSEAAKISVSKDYRYFNLADSTITRIIDSTSISSKPQIYALKKYGFSDISIYDSTRIDLKKFRIKNARYFPGNSYPVEPGVNRKDTLIYLPLNSQIVDSLNRHDHKFFYNVADKGWTKQQVSETILKNRKMYESNFKDEDYSQYYFSTPVFSNDKRYAYIEIIRSWAKGTRYLFKFEDKKWVLVTDMGHWIR